MSKPLLAKKSTVLYKDPAAGIEARVKDLLSRMTLEEKIGQMAQLNIGLINITGKQKDVELDKEKARKYILKHKIGSFLNGEAVPAEDWYEYYNELQKIAIEESRLGIPVIYGIDHMHGASYLKGATIFPHNINLAASFNSDNVSEMAKITAIESSDIGHHWLFAPVLDLGRNPNWPRFYETFGESPYIAAKMGSAYVKALKNVPEMNPYKVASTAKHFIGYSDPKSGWDRTPVDLSDQTIHEFHVPSFKAAIDAGLSTVMLNSGEINGIPVHASEKIVRDLLRKKLGFDGIVITDWDDIGKLIYYHHVAHDYTHATELAINAGIDVSMTPNSLEFNTSLMELVEKGKVTKERIDESVRRVLKLKFELGLFEHPFPRKDRFQRIGSTEHKAKALKAAEESLVLLKNEENVLPLSPSIQKILVLGPAANTKADLSGGWTYAWQGAKPDEYPESMHTIYSALLNSLGSAEVTLMEENASLSSVREEAANHDLVLVAFGEKPYTEFVGNITSLELPEDQQALIRAAADSKTPAIGIYVGGRPRIISSIIDELSAFIWAGLPGFEGADAIANVISGKVNPSGRLPFSFPMHESHVEPHNHKPSSVYVFNPDEANFIAQDEHNIWQWPFGYGLSYTTYEYSDLELSEPQIGPEGFIEAKVKVTNAGQRSGIETVIWYVKDEVGSISRPVRQVKHFERICLEPGESKTVSFHISPRSDLVFPDQEGRPLLEEGYFTVIVQELKARFRLINPEQDSDFN